MAKVIAVLYPDPIRPSERMSRDTVTGRRNSRTRLRVSCHPSRTSEHSSVGRRKDVKVFGCSDDWR